MLNEKDREEIRQTIAQALAGSITGRVEHIITDALSTKVGHMQQAQAEAEAKTEEARKEEASYRERIVAAERQLNELRAAIKVDMATHAKAMKDLGAKKKALELKIDEMLTATAALEKADEDRIATSRKHTEETILEHQKAIKEKKEELDALTSRHLEFRKSVGL